MRESSVSFQHSKSVGKSSVVPFSIRHSVRVLVVISDLLLLLDLVCNSLSQKICSWLLDQSRSSHADVKGPVIENRCTHASEHSHGRLFFFFLNYNFSTQYNFDSSDFKQGVVAYAKANTLFISQVHMCEYIRRFFFCLLSF